MKTSNHQIGRGSDARFVRQKADQSLDSVEMLNLGRLWRQFVPGYQGEYRRKRYPLSMHPQIAFGCIMSHIFSTVISMIPVSVTSLIIVMDLGALGPTGLFLDFDAIEFGSGRLNHLN